MTLLCNRRQLLRLAVGGARAGVAAGCDAPSQASRAARAAPEPAPKSTAGLSLAVAMSEIVVGPSRFSLALLEGGRPVTADGVLLEFFTVQGSEATKQGEAVATLRSIDGVKGVYTARTKFDRPGAWGVQATLTRPGQASVSARTGFEVRPSGFAPLPGARAIMSRLPLATDTPNLADICSAQPPCAMHALGVPEALALGKPLLLAFATPGYCTSQTCAPVLGEVQKVAEQRREQASFIHVEIYKDPRNLVVADAVREWGLQSEPWVFLIDREGVIRDRIDGLTTADELDGVLGPVV
jgi:hypothetical protein